MVQHTEKDEEKGQGHLNVGPFSIDSCMWSIHMSVPLLLLLITIIGTNVEPT